MRTFQELSREGTRIVKRSLVVALLVSYGLQSRTAYADDAWSEVWRQEVCTSDDPVDDLACRVHREGAWEVLTRLVSLAEAHRVPIPQRSPRGPGVIERDISSMSADLQRAGVPPASVDRRVYEQALILSALDAVPTLLSSARYGYEMASDPTAVPPNDPITALEKGIGICGNHVQLFDAVLRKLGLRTRTVQFWWRDDNGKSVSHIALEVFWNGRWRLYDPTFGAFFVAADDDAAAEPLGAEDARRRHIRPVLNPMRVTYRYYLIAGADPFAHLKREDVDVTVGGKGVVTVPLEGSPDERASHFLNVPNYVGDNQADGVPDGQSFRFRGLAGRYTATIDITGEAGCTRSQLLMNEQPIPVEPGVHTLAGVENPETLQISGPDDVCYVVLKEIRFTREASSGSGPT